ncbi:uncharacterized protein PRCAT00001828001 [Priceomyces carsonii]|uniref:uncharacterized protein n=1 Tax=Priceomyces carsonii TaxID=28549 RepID=UPI002ED8766E|nr:unnamed protein product [Priceomyces carsonii]
MKMIQFVFLKMKHYNIKPSEEFFLLVSKYYASEGKFLPLLQFLESSCSKTKFNYVYVKLLFQSLVDSYPYYALEFKSNFDLWVKMNPAISVQMQDLLQNSFKIKKLDSQITPFALYRNLLCLKKYDSTNWQKLEWKHDKSGKIINCTEQINYRINKGFKDVLRKGVRPDLKIIENTFRRLNFDNRQKIIHLLKMIRMYDRIENKLNVYDLQLKPDKQKLKLYFHNVSWSKLNSYHLLTLSRLFMNKRLYYETEEILKCIRPEEMSSRSLMIKWNIQMRNCLFYSRFDEMKLLIDDFRLDEVTLSPYLYKQCCHIEKLLINKLNALKKKEYLGGAEALTRDGKILNQTRILDMLKQLRGFIGDVDIRLTEDKIEIRAKVHEMFKFLDSWLHSDRSNDNRLL